MRGVINVMVKVDLILILVKPVMVGVTINLMSEYSTDSTTNLAIVSLMPIVPV
mgnify:CR=1 FL=1